ncbi:MarR family winged helix-turn-helix transcriptional regulator [Streptomyces sp. NPDC006012]|uniref:MarR family winged helix-turn-helix transcriptional regulator n=1 Tax=Streptomyces sp. NPDC006012 TaxID=3364739 RepID=UPI0036B72D64
MVRLRARLRTESAATDRRWTWSRITTLSRVDGEGPTTASALAAAEHVRPQSMAETVAALVREGLVVRGPDPDDGRKTLISVPEAGRELLAAIPAVREAWLERAIERHLSPAERRTLAEAARIMESLADS